MSREADYLPVVDGVTRDLDAGPEFPGIRVLGRGPSVSGG
jgi:hypothetical protein